jgi:hypothetical protein
MAETIIVAGSLAQRPGNGGHATVFLQYMLGFRSLGYDVLFLDRLEPGMCIDGSGRPTEFERSENVRYLAAVMEGAGLGGCWSVRYDDGAVTAGLDRRVVVERAQRSVLLVNVMGYLDDEELLAAAPITAFLDVDPGFGQMWRALGLHDAFVGHDHYVTVGSRVGTPGCVVPGGGIEWITTLPPVAIDDWPATSPPGGPTRFTTIATWRGPFGPIEYDGHVYGLRVHEFRKFLDLPGRIRAAFEVALDIDESDAADRRRLVDGGWLLADPRLVASDPFEYRRYINGSSAELMIAKNMYVDTRGGWFSDRSACYLAAGRPVLAQDTGFGDVLPIGDGIVVFSTTDEAVAGADEIIGNYDHHARAARELAVEHLAATTVLVKLLTALGVR